MGLLLHRAVAVEGWAGDAGTIFVLARAAVVLASENGDRLAVLELEDTVDLPAVRQRLRSVCEARNVVVEIGGKMVADIIVRVAPVACKIAGILRQNIENAGVIQVVAPGVGKLTGKTMPGVAAQRKLQRVIAGRGAGVDLVDDAEVGVLVEVWSRGLLRRERIAVHGDSGSILILSQRWLTG